MSTRASWFDRHKNEVILVMLAALLLAIFVILAIFG